MDIVNKSLIKDKCYINGEWIDSYNKESIAVNNPSSLEIIAKVPKCGKEETNFAIMKANEAWSDWKNKPAIERSSLLKKWFNLIEENHEDLAKIMTLEQGKPIIESRGEITYGASFVEWFAEEAKRIYGDIIPDRLSDKKNNLLLNNPVGCSKLL